MCGQGCHMCMPCKGQGHHQPTLTGAADHQGNQAYAVRTCPAMQSRVTALQIGPVKLKRPVRTSSEAGVVSFRLSGALRETILRSCCVWGERTLKDTEAAPTMTASRKLLHVAKSAQTEFRGSSSSMCANTDSGTCSRGEETTRSFGHVD